MGRNITLKLKFTTPVAWTEAVLADFDSFLIDHAAAEKKASGMAVSMMSHYPDKQALVKAMIDLAIEEMTHFRKVVKLLYQRGLQPGADTKDSYVNEFRKVFRKGKEAYLLDRLLVAGIIEARGCERFGLLAAALPPGKMQSFYHEITQSEAKHHTLFVDLAGQYFAEDEIATRLSELLEVEADIAASLPISAALH